MNNLSDAMTRFRAGLSPQAQEHWDEAVARIAAKAARGETIKMVPDTCPTCQGAGMVVSGDYDPQRHTAGPTLMPCPACSAGKALVTAGQQRLIGGSGLEPYLDWTFERVTPTADQAEHYAAARKWLDGEVKDWISEAPQEHLWISGVFFSGKTTLAKCIGNALIAQGRVVLYRVETTMWDELRETYDDANGSSFASQFDHLCQADVLIIDDLGKAKRTEWVEEKRFALLDYRFEHAKPLVITTNVTQQEAEKTMPRLARRIWDSQRVFVMDMAQRYSPIQGLRGLE